MKKKTISIFFDKFFWYLIFLLPIFAMLIIMAKTGDFVGFSDAFQSLGLTGLDNSTVYTSLAGIFGTGGIMPIFATPDLLLYFSYFIYANIIHLFVDFLLFIPRLANKWLNGVTGGEE